MSVNIVTDKGTYNVQKELQIRRVFQKNNIGLPSANVIFEIKDNPENESEKIVTAYGGGFGHGVGMSQYGAGAMAKKGYTYDEIIQHYFTDTAITTYPVTLVAQNGQDTALQNFYTNRKKAFLVVDNRFHFTKLTVAINGQEVRPLDISITKTVVVLFIDAILLLLCILIPARWCKKHKPEDPAPKGFVGLMHMFIMYIYDDVIKASLGKEANKYAPYLLTCFFFIFIANIMGIVPFPPGGGNLTGNITITFFLALCTFLITNFTGTKAYWKDIFWPEVPTWLKAPIPLMPIIEFFSIFTKPLALMIRLFANMLAGHAIALSLACIIFIMFGINAAAGTSMTVVSVAMSIFMMLLEVLVCFIQALVFTMLSSVFISLAHVHEHSK